MVYYKNLDFLRFIAVFLVLAQHWLLQGFFLDIGKIGVTVFFVLSGFLITGILLKSKQDIEDKKLSVKKAIANFYVRRSLRIFPIYFLLIGFLFVMNYEIVTSNFIWFLTYTSNIKTFIDQNWMASLGPLWTLAVEEQFYFIWPALIFFVQKKNTKKLLIICMLIGPLFRLCAMLLAIKFFDNVNLYVSSITLMPSNIDLFAIGGVLAYNIRYKENIVSIPRRFILLFSFLLFIPVIYFKGSIFYHIFFVWIIAIWSFFIISYLIKENNVVSNSIFQFKPFSFLGKISYGLYLYHGPFFFIFAIISFAELKLFKNQVLFADYHKFNQFIFLKNVSYLILFATISWYTIEKPINKLKKYFK